MTSKPPQPKTTQPTGPENPDDETRPDKPVKPGLAKEIGGPKGPEPTRYGDWERKGIVSDF